MGLSLNHLIECRTPILHSIHNLILTFIGYFYKLIYNDFEIFIE